MPLTAHHKPMQEKWAGRTQQLETVCAPCAEPPH